MARAWPDSGRVPLTDTLARVLADGPAVGIHAALTAERPGVVPSAIGSLIDQKLVFHLADPTDRSLLGVPRTRSAPAIPGRAFWAHSDREVQVALSDDLPATEPGERLPVGIGQLPAAVAIDQIGNAVVEGSGRWSLPLGIGEHALEPIGWSLGPGEHALIAGPPRSGRTTALECLAAVAHRSRHLRVVGLADPHRSSLARSAHLDVVVQPGAVDELVRLVGTTSEPLLVLVDDAERIEDPDGLLEHALRQTLTTHVVAAGRADALRTGFSHWTRAVRASRTGLLLQPDPDLDGELLGTRVPRHPPVPLTAGRGWLIGDRSPEIVQIAGNNIS